MLSVFSMSNVYAQDISDALKYSQDNIQGSARFRALSGAFGALGGDMSAVGLNPAGSAIFNRSHASFSLSTLGISNDVSYFNGNTSSTESKIDMHQAGGVFVFVNTNESSSWKKFVLSLAYDKTANHGDQWYANGQNTNSIDSYFLAYSQGLRLDEISAFPGETISEAYGEIGSIYGYANQQAFLGYESFILEPVNNSDGNTSYVSNIAQGTFNQKYDYIANGYNGKISFNAATQYEDKLYLGLNLNAHFINFEKYTYLQERNSNAGSVVSNVNFENSLFTTGNGFSFQIGAIYKLTNELRAGFTYNSPIWYRINEETTQSLTTTVNDIDGSFNAIVNPNIINIFPEYRLQSPGKITGSLAYVFKDKGLLSFDYSRRDYRNTEFRPTTDTFFALQNQTIEDVFKAANTYRFGGEYKYKKMSFRAGYRFEESPYQDDSFYGDLTGYSLGLGYDFGMTRLDLTFDQANREINNPLYSVGLTDSANIDATNSNITLSLAFNL